MTAQMPDYPIGRRVHGVWKKFSDWYGADVIAKNFGAIPPREWCEEIDTIGTRAELDRILADVRAKHVTFPPRFPEFESIVARVQRPRQNDGPSMQERLCDYVLKHKALTRMQLVRPWTYLGTGNARTGEGFAITGVVVPADGDTPGYRVMVADLALSDDP